MLAETNKQQYPNVSRFFQTLLDNSQVTTEPKKNYEFFSISDAPNVKRIQFRVPNLLENKIKRLGGTRIINAPFSKKIPCTEVEVCRNKIDPAQRWHSYPKLNEKTIELKPIPKVPEPDVLPEKAIPKPRNRGNSVFVAPKMLNQAKIEEEWTKLKALHKQEKAKRKGHRGPTSTYRLFRMANKKDSTAITSNDVIFESKEETEKSSIAESKIKRKMSRFYIPADHHPTPIDVHVSHQMHRRQSRIPSSATASVSNHHFAPQAIPTLAPPLVEIEGVSDSESGQPRRSVDRRSAVGNNALKKKKPKKRAFGIVLDDRMSYSQKQIEEINRIVDAFDRHQMPIDKQKLERALLDPIDKKLQLLGLPKDDEPILSDDDSVPDKRRRPVNKKKNVIRHSQSTKILHIKTIVAEPKMEPSRIRERFSSVYHAKGPSHQFVQPKTNSWWTRQEYYQLRSSIYASRHAKSVQKETPETKIKPFRPESAQEKRTCDVAFKSSKSQQKEDQGQKYSSEGVLLDDARPSSRLSDLPKSVFMDSNVFSRPRSGASERSTKSLNEYRAFKDINGQRLQSHSAEEKFSTADPSFHERFPGVIVHKDSK